MPKPRKPEDDFFAASKRRALSKEKAERLGQKIMQRTGRKINNAFAKYIAFWQRFLVESEEFGKLKHSEKWLTHKDLALRHIVLLQYRIGMLEREWEFEKVWINMRAKFGKIVKLPRIIVDRIAEAPREITRVDEKLQRYRADYKTLKKRWEKQMVLLLQTARNKMQYAKLNKAIEAEKRKEKEKTMEFNEFLKKMASAGETHFAKNIEAVANKTAELVQTHIKVEEKELERLQFLHREASQLRCTRDFIEELTKQIYEQKEIIFSFQKQIKKLESG